MLLLFPAIAFCLPQSTKTFGFFKPKFNKPIWNDSDLIFAKKIAIFASAAYVDNISLINNYNCSIYLNQTNITVVENEGNRALVAVGDEIIVSFRGTKNIQNIIQDIKFFKVKFNETSEAWVHKGFMNAYQLLKPEIEENLQKLRNEYPDKLVVFTGHSLGAAMATLAAMDHGYAKLIIFGSPRVGEGIQMRNVLRLVSKGDMVDKVPPQKLGYKHFSEKKMIIGDTAYSCGIEDEMCNSFEDSKRAHGRFFGVDFFFTESHCFKKP